MQRSALEADVLSEINRARANPGDVAASIRGRLEHIKGKDYFPPERGGKTAVVTKEGVAAVNDALAFLERQDALPQLETAMPEGLRLAAEDHLTDLGGNGTVGHSGSDGMCSSDRMNRYGQWHGKCGEVLWFGRTGATARQMIEDLIVDDGVASRGHRLGIYDAAYRVAGIRVGEHKTFGECCVADMSTGFSDDSTLISNRLRNGPRASVASAPVKTQWSKLGKCPGCQEQIHGGSVMEVLGNKWHKECFKCKHCSLALAGVKYQEHAGTPYCVDCYYEQHGSMCRGCRKTIRGGVMKACGGTWHKECFVCQTCAGPVGQKFATRDGAPLCDSCRTGGGSARPISRGSAPVCGSPASTGLAAAKAKARSTLPARGPSPLPGAGSSLIAGGAPKAKAKAKSAAPKTKLSMGGHKSVVNNLGMDYASLGM